MFFDMQLNFLLRVLPLIFIGCSHRPPKIGAPLISICIQHTHKILIYCTLTCIFFADLRGLKHPFHSSTNRTGGITGPSRQHHTVAQMQKIGTHRRDVQKIFPTPVSQILTLLSLFLTFSPEQHVNS